jgi:hypothetical protein
MIHMRTLKSDVLKQFSNKNGWRISACSNCGSYTIYKKSATYYSRHSVAYRARCCDRPVYWSVFVKKNGMFYSPGGWHRGELTPCRYYLATEIIPSMSTSSMPILMETDFVDYPWQQVL